MSDTNFQWIGIRKGWEQAGRLEESLVSLPTEDLKTHAMVIGATGSGKTNLLHHLIAQDLLRGHSIVVLDMRGDLASAALEFCAGNVEPSNIALFDLREREKPLGFNPIAGSGEPYFRALAVLEVIASESESWGVQLSETLRNAILLLAETRKALPSLERLLHDASFRNALLARSGEQTIIDFWERYGELSKDKQAALAVPVLNKVSLLFATKALRGTLGHPTPLQLANHLDTKGSVTLVSLAVDELHGAGRMMGNLMLSAITREVFARVNTSEAQRNPIRLYVDEFENFSTTVFEQILAEGRRFGLSVVLAHQTLAQLTPKVRSMILNNVGVKVVFRTGREDGATLCKDLTSDPKAYDLTTLPVGEAVLWRRNKPIEHVEINAPLIKSVGAKSEAVRALLRELKDAIPEITKETSIEKVAEDPQPQRKNRPQEGLEDWL